MYNCTALLLDNPYHHKRESDPQRYGTAAVGTPVGDGDLRLPCVLIELPSYTGSVDNGDILMLRKARIEEQMKRKNSCSQVRMPELLSRLWTSYLYQETMKHDVL